MRTCCISSCRNDRTSNVSLHMIPKNLQDGTEWLNFIARANGVSPKSLTGNLYVCRKHFRKCCLPGVWYHNVTIKKGHYPSLVGNEVILNSLSKCDEVSPDENLRPFTRPMYSNETEKRRALLVEKLTSFGTQKKIIVGDRKRDISGNFKCDQREEKPLHNGTLKDSIPIQSSLSSPAVATSAFFADHNQCKPPKMKFVGGNRTLNQNQHVTENYTTEFSISSDVSIEHVRPSLEAKIEKLQRENRNFKRSVLVLVKKVDEMEKKIEELNSVFTHFGALLGVIR